MALKQLLKSLYDAYGRRVQTGALKKELAAPTLSGIRTVWSDTVASGLTPMRLARLLQASVEGDHEAYLTLAEEMEERDSHYASVLGTRKRAVSGIKPIIEPASSSRQDQQMAAAVKEMIERPGIQEGVAKLLDGLGKGFAVGEIMWQTGPRWEPVALTWRDPRFFVFDQVTRSEIRLRDEANLALGVPLAPFKFVCHLPKLKTGIPIRNGLARLVAWSYFFKFFGIKHWMILEELFGVPLRLGRYDQQASEGDKDVLKRAVLELGSEGAGIISKSMDIDFIELNNLSGSVNLFERTADWFDAQTSKAVLGQTMTTDDGSSLAQAKVHNEVRHDIKEADANDLEQTLQRDLIKPYIDLNFGPQQTYPRIAYPVKRPEDTESLSRSVAALVQVGLEVRQSEMRDRLGLSEPQEGDKLLVAPAASAAAAAASAATESGRNYQRGCRHCGVALNQAAADGGEADLDEIETPFLDDWQQQMEPLLGPLRALFERAASYDELKAGLADLAAELGDTDQRLIEALAMSGFLAYGLGNAEDD